jgi:acyl carrier protein
MDKQQFISKFEEEVVMVEPGSLSLDTKLDSIDEWDSVAMVALVALLDESYGVHLKANALKEMTTIADIVNYIEAHS